MMRLIMNSEPVFHKHICDVGKRNSVMSDEVLHDFSVGVLMEEYASAGVSVHRVNRVNGNEADLQFCSHGRCVNIKVICKGRGAGPEMIDTSWLVDEYRAHGSFPRLVFADAWCMSDVSNDGKPEVCGGDFCFRYECVSVIPDQCNVAHKDMSDYEIAVCFLNAWQNLDTDVVEPFIDSSFHYSSKWVFDEIPCRIEYIDYLKGKFNAIRSSANHPDVSVGMNNDGGYALLFNQNGVPSQLELSIEKGYIVSARMTDNDGRYVQCDDDELYMGHGDHNECILPLNEFVERLQDILQSSKVHLKNRTNVVLDDDSALDTDVYSLRYGEGDISFLSLIAFNEPEQCNVYVSSFPLMKGFPTEVRIDRVAEWNNRVEATVFASVGDFSFAFFAADYYVNKDCYRPGRTISVDLAALGMKVKEAQTSFSFDGQDAIDWLEKIGKKPDYDVDGNVMPVEFNMEMLVTYLSLDSKAPDEARFRSPARVLSSSINLCDRVFECVQIAIHRFDNDEVLNVPLFFHNDSDMNINRNVPLSGFLWLTGYVTGKHKM